MARARRDRTESQCRPKSGGAPRPDGAHQSRARRAFTCARSGKLSSASARARSSGSVTLKFSALAGTTTTSTPIAFQQRHVVGRFDAGAQRRFVRALASRRDSQIAASVRPRVRCDPASLSRRCVSASTTLIVSTTGAASNAPRPGRTSRIPAQHVPSRNQRARAIVNEDCIAARASSARETVAHARLARRAAFDHNAAPIARRSFARARASRSSHIGSVTIDELAQLRHHACKGARATTPTIGKPASSINCLGARSAFRARPQRSPQPQVIVRCALPRFRSREDHAAGDGLQHARDHDVGRLRRSAGGPCSTTIIVPSSK